MNDVELKVLLDELRGISNEALVRQTNVDEQYFQMQHEALCELKGGHDFVASPHMSGKFCKFCKMIKRA